VFVNHLGHRVAKQHHVLIERLDLPLKLDAIDQVDGHWNMFSTQCVEERVLQKLAFIAHDILRVQDVVVNHHLTTAKRTLGRGEAWPLSDSAFDYASSFSANGL